MRQRVLAGLITILLPLFSLFPALVNFKPAGASPIELNGRIGVIGCSNTWQHAFGYQEQSSEDSFWAWEDVRPYSGGALTLWADPTSTYWSVFDSNLSKYPDTGSVWFQVCFKAAETSASGMTASQQTNLLSVINSVRQRLPDVPIFVSPMNGFTANDCPSCGPYGYSNSFELADWAAANGHALRGPNTGPLSHSQLQGDKCHLNSAGRAVVGVQLSDFFDYVDAPDVTPPSTVTNLSATNVSHDSAVISWDNATDDTGVTNYVVERDGVEIAEPTTNTFSDSGLAPLTDYSYVVYAEDAAGNRSPASNSLAVTTTETPDIIAPTTPTNLSSEVIAEDEVDLTWEPSTDNEGVSQYVINRNGEFLASTTDLSYADTTVVPGPTYTYTVQAEDLSGNQSDPSSPAEATIEDLETPTAPANLATTSLIHNQISLTWDASTDNGVVVRYVIERDGVEIGEATNISYTDSTVNELTTYSYVVYAEDGAGNRSVASSPLIVVTPEAPDTTPPTVALTSPAASSTVSGTVNVSADASDNEQVTSVEIRVDGIPAATLTNLPYEYSWDTTLVAEGSHTLTAVATDSSGNTATSSVTVTVDNVPDSQFTASAYVVNAGDTVTFYDGLTSGQKRKFFFGDGTKTVTTFSTATKTYLVPGTYNASLETISLQTGLRTTFSLTIVVL